MESMQICQALLDEPRLDTAVRSGDVYGLMIEHSAEIGQFEQVSETIPHHSAAKRQTLLGFVLL